MKYYPRFDSIRAIAAFLVILNHWAPASSWFHKTPLATIGVTIFFVLSGFLISLILFKNTKKCTSLGLSKLYILKVFYLKRILRIMPIYFLFVFGVFVFRRFLNVPDDIFLYLTTFTTNLHIYHSEQWPGFLSPLWTLAVEEQFYLLFPILYVFLSRKLFLLSLVVATGVGMLVPVIINQPFIQIHTYSCLDSFGLGIMYAYYYFIGKDNIKINVFIVGVGLAALIFIMFSSIGIVTGPVDYPLLTSLFTVSLIALVVNGKSLLGIDLILNLKTVQFLGKISYGIYLYHTLVGKLYNMAIRKLVVFEMITESKFWFSFSVSFTLKLIFLVILSLLSWTIIEKKLLNYKNKKLVLS